MRKIGSEWNETGRWVRLGEIVEAMIEKQENSETRHHSIRPNVRKLKIQKAKKIGRN